MLTDEFKESRPKSVVVARNVDAVWEPIMQDYHVIYREIKTSLGINIGHKLAHIRYYTKIKVFEEIKHKKEQPTTILRFCILLYDNAHCHTSAETIRFLEDQKIELTGHLPYSPDFTPNDF
ncbi:hypothetical protein EVAR_55002_1 [Eumeta japonica]|uniref:Histone-lysine N-methyltransferase SETMAR n=1 Tax=Eumeta variegata TaxID=151549 RepID=A0A4C1YAY8_EUMVA|nr:hypothetical protein EVAR_55002_1 [Eumeta japonica]